MNKDLNEAAEKYAKRYKTEVSSEGLENIADDFKAGAQWQLEQKQVVSDEEIEKMAEKEYPILETIKGNKVSGHILGYQHAMKTGFIKGFKLAIQYAKPSAGVWRKGGFEFAKWLEGNTTVIKEEKITLYRYCDKNNEWGNYTLADIYTEYNHL